MTKLKFNPRDPLADLIPKGEFSPDKHPHASNGQFASTGGSGGGAAPAPAAAPTGNTPPASGGGKVSPSGQSTAGSYSPSLDASGRNAPPYTPADFDPATVNAVAAKIKEQLDNKPFQYNPATPYMGEHRIADLHLHADRLDPDDEKTTDMFWQFARSVGHALEPMGISIDISGPGAYFYQESEPNR